MQFNIMSQGQTTDLFFQISVKEMTCLWKESVAGKKAIQG